MMACEDVRAKLHLYFDQELTAHELLSIEAHLLDCVACRKEHDTLRYVIDTVRGARPLYDVPAESHVRAQALVLPRRTFHRGWMGGFLAIGCTVAFIAAFFTWKQISDAGRFTVFAADVHQRYARGLLPLDIVTSEAAEINAWLARRMPFHLALPSYPAEANGQKRYQLTGARLVQFGSRDAAYVAYEMGKTPISLVIASATDVTPAGGEILRSGNLTFHFLRHQGLETISWKDGGLSYALVTDIGASGAESCVVCHGSAGERRKFEQLRRE